MNFQSLLVTQKLTFSLSWILIPLNELHVERKEGVDRRGVLFISDKSVNNIRNFVFPLFDVSKCESLDTLETPLMGEA
jgi:hypothetical protein